MTTRTLILSTIGLIAAVALIFIVAQPRNHQTGGKSVDLALNDMAGKTINLADYRGKVVLVDVWATWCGYCVDEIPDLIALQEKADAEQMGLQIVGISVDQDTGALERFVHGTHFNYPVLHDNTGAVKRLGNVSGLPTKFIINREGDIVETIVGSRSAEYLQEIVAKHLQ